MDRLTKALRALDHKGMSATLSPVATSEACTEEEAAAVRERARAWWSGLDAYARERACDMFASRYPGYGNLMGPITAYSADRSMLQQCTLHSCAKGIEP
ncbi:MAG: hypothetical protein JNM07_14395 [Phycisphaerae bacterium]|nr:hypothetical protein [Phycisphaerae bacterium]